MPGPSSVANGSSRSQSGASDTSRRASAARLRCPCESLRTGRAGTRSRARASADAPLPPPRPTPFAGARPGEAAEDTQQARLAAAVRARHAQQLALGEDEGNRAEQGPRAALAFELRRFEHAAIVAETRLSRLLPRVLGDVLQRDLGAVDVAACVDRDAFGYVFLIGLGTGAGNHRPHHAVLRAADANASAEPGIQLGGRLMIRDVERVVRVDVDRGRTAELPPLREKPAVLEAGFSRSG